MIGKISFPRIVYLFRENDGHLYKLTNWPERLLFYYFLRLLKAEAVALQKIRLSSTKSRKWMSIVHG